MRWADPTEERACWIANHLRPEDETEVWLSHRIQGPEAVLMSWADSDICRCIETSDGLPVGLTGLTGDRIWMLGTAELTATRKRQVQLCREGRLWVEHCVERVGGPIWNDVYAKNVCSIRWLKHLGFTVEPARPVGLSAALFCRFWRDA
jgi:hypothetical protein